MLAVRPHSAGRGPDAPPPRLRPHPPRPSRSPLSSFRRPCYFCLFSSANLPGLPASSTLLSPSSDLHGAGRVVGVGTAGRPPGHCPAPLWASRRLGPLQRGGLARTHVTGWQGECHQLSLAQARLRRGQGWFPGICRDRHGPGRTSLGGASGTAGGPRALWSVWCTAPPPLGMRGNGTEVEREALAHNFGTSAAGGRGSGLARLPSCLHVWSLLHNHVLILDEKVRRSP